MFVLRVILSIVLLAATAIVYGRPYQPSLARNVTPDKNHAATLALSQFRAAPYQQPTFSDDVTKGNLPGAFWRSNSQNFVAIQTGKNNALWRAIDNLPFPGDVYGDYVTKITIDNAGSGYSAGEILTFDGGLTAYLISVVSGVPTAPSFAGYITPSGSFGHLTITAMTAGTVGAGTQLSGTGIPAPAPGLERGYYIIGQLRGTTGGAGVYLINVPATVATSGSPEAMTGSAVGWQPLDAQMTVSIATSGTMTVASTPGPQGCLVSGSPIYGPGIPASETVTAVGTAGASCGAGTYTVSPAPSLAVSSTIIQSTSPTQPIMRGICPTSTSLTGLAPITQTGEGSGLTVNVTFMQPWMYGVMQLTQCMGQRGYASSLYQIENSVTQATTNIAPLSNGLANVAPALATVVGSKQPQYYLNYNDGPTAGVSILYDQSLNGDNITADGTSSSYIPRQPVMFAPRKMGNSIPILFNSIGSAVSNFPSPSVTELVIPNTVSFNSTDVSVVWMGGIVSGPGQPQFQFTPVGGVSTAPLYLAAASNCNNQLATGAGGSLSESAIQTPETPSVITCDYRPDGYSAENSNPLLYNGYLYQDSTYLPTPTMFANFNVSVFGAGGSKPSAITLTVYSGNGCPVSIPGGVSSYSVTYTAQSTDTFSAGSPATVQNILGKQTFGVNFNAAINNDPVLSAAGIVAVGLSSGQWFRDNFVLPQNTYCKITLAGANGISASLAAGSSGTNGWPMRGGTIGYTAKANGSGQQYLGALIVVPWAVSLATEQRARWALQAETQTNGHPGIVINGIAASNFSGYQTPFLNDVFQSASEQLGRDDLVVIDTSVAGVSLVREWNGWGLSSANGASNAIPQYTTGGSPSSPSNSQICMIEAEVNSLNTVGSNVTEFNAIQNIANACHGFGWKAICSTGYLAKYNSTQFSEVAILREDLLGLPGAGTGLSSNVCDVIVDPQSSPALANSTGPWNPPLFTAAGNHLSEQGTRRHGKVLMDAVRAMAH